MSSKKDKSSNLDKYFMSIAMNLAKERIGLTGLNPSVGCVIIKNNSVINVGCTSINGRPHAEANAIKESKTKLMNAALYVTLEPCSHSGKTPPCTKAIINSGIKKVFFSINDPDPRSFKKKFISLKKKRCCCI